jgi:hypothetical protein
MSGYSQICLNLPLNDHHYGYMTKFRISSRMDASFAQRKTEAFYVRDILGGVLLSSYNAHSNLYIFSLLVSCKV